MFTYIKAVSGVVFDMTNAIYHEKSLFLSMLNYCERLKQYSADSSGVVYLLRQSLMLDQ